MTAPKLLREMKASKLIDLIKQQIIKHGDAPIFIEDYGFLEIDDVRFSNIHDPQFKTIKSKINESIIILWATRTPY